MRNITSRVIDIVAEQFGVERDTINQDTHLVNDLAADELDQVELLVGLEDEFDISLNEDIFYNCATVGSVTNLVSNALN